MFVGFRDDLRGTVAVRVDGRLEMREFDVVPMMFRPWERHYTRASEWTPVLVVTVLAGLVALWAWVRRRPKGGAA